GHVLMERAGAGTARVLRERLRRPRGPVVVVCGRGNNGGDGFVVARHLRRARVPVEVWLAARPEEVRGDAARMLAAWRRARGAVHALAAPAHVEALARRLARAAAVGDALFGTGLNAPVTQSAAHPRRWPRSRPASCCSRARRPGRSCPRAGATPTRAPSATCW